MTFKLFRRGSAKCIGLLSAFVTILICLYYISIGQSSQNKTEFHLHNTNSIQKYGKNAKHQVLYSSNTNEVIAQHNLKCYQLFERETNITTSTEFANFDFQPEWIRTKEYWDKTFEERHEAQMKNTTRPSLKVILVMHSHNDPGWLKTYINYFQSDSRQILNHIICKMQEYADMTFIWSEISFLQLWWDQAHPTKRRALKKLINSGRFEITTGGWVMTDEANVHMFAMIDQLVEGHQWIKVNLNTTPTVGWSIDPFGHGATVPYLLAASGFEGTIIQRIHYAWKQWFAKHQYGDFLWKPFWKLPNSNKHGINEKRFILTHNMPFDIYSIKHSCGPHPYICLNFDFRKIPGEYTEYSTKAQFITDENVADKAQLLLNQYARTASLFSHNVALIPIGDDFRYNKIEEVDQQYNNYKKLIDFINAHKDIYHTDIQFGTPRDYFREIQKRNQDFPSLKGDFFVYSDIFAEGRPAYWSGYFTTRPFYKILSSELEHNLRASEILFSVAYNIVRQNQHNNAIKVLEKNYEKLILARRNLGLFQHHDAITGTSKAAVMRDYGLRLYESTQDTIKMQESSIEILLQNDHSYHHSFLLNGLEHESFGKLPKNTPITLKENEEGSFVIFNSLAQKRFEIMSIRTYKPNVLIVNENGIAVVQQINPVWNLTENYELKVSAKQYSILFLAELPPLYLTTYRVIPRTNYKADMATIYCDECVDNTTNNKFDIKIKQPGDIQLENNKMRLLFDEKSGFLKSITRKNVGKPIQCGIKFAAYKSAEFHSGAYLFKTDPEEKDAERDVLEQYDNVRIIITSGPLASDVTVIYSPFLAHTVRIFNTRTFMDNAIYIENDIDFELPPKNRETELFMRFLTDIENGEPPEFYSDQNGFQFHKRVKVPSIGIEGNYFPITSAAFIQDTNKRLTLITNHAQGAASLEPGLIEVMLDRRTLYDDYRGMGEGIVDSRLTRHKFWLVIENFPNQLKNTYQMPSLLATLLINNLRYPPNIYFLEDFDFKLPTNLKRGISMIKHNIPCDFHLLNLRTLTEEEIPLFPSNSALFILHHQGYDCSIDSEDLLNIICNNSTTSLPDNLFNHLLVKNIQSTSLTGINNLKTLKGFSDIYLEPMDIKTFKITFKF